MIQVHDITSASGAPHTSDKDAALAVVSEVAQEIDPIVEKRVLRKIDLYLMPAMLIGQF
jgi:ribosomal protein S20